MTNDESLETTEAEARPLPHPSRAYEQQCEEIRIDAAERGFVHGSRDWETFVEGMEASLDTGEGEAR